MSSFVSGFTLSVHERANAREEMLETLKTLSFWKEAMPALEDMEKTNPRRAAAYLRTAGKAHALPALILPDGAEETDEEERDLNYYRRAVGFGDDMLSLLPEQERIILTIFSSNAYLNQRIEIARQALHCEKSQVCRLRNRALDHARQLFTGSWEDGSGCPLKIGDTEGTKSGHTEKNDAV